MQASVSRYTQDAPESVQTMADPNGSLLVNPLKSPFLWFKNG